MVVLGEPSVDQRKAESLWTACPGPGCGWGNPTCMNYWDYKSNLTTLQVMGGRWYGFSLPR